MFQVFWESVLVDERKPHHPTSWDPISCVAEQLQLFHFPFSQTICLNFPKVELWFAVHTLAVHLPMDIVAPEIQGSKVMASIVSHELHHCLGWEKLHIFRGPGVKSNGQHRAMRSRGHVLHQSR